MAPDQGQPLRELLFSHSQFGEDMLLRSLTRDRPFGFYVDVGAHHPFYYSNTFHFYSKGWRGINIDAVPGSMKPFLQLRPRDVNLEACVGMPGRWVEFSIFEEQTLNTMDAGVALKLVQQNRSRLVGKQKFQTQSLAQILERHMPSGQTIDFLSVDVEGADLEVLQSNDWPCFDRSSSSPRVMVASFKRSTRSQSQAFWQATAMIRSL